MNEISLDELLPFVTRVRSRFDANSPESEWSFGDLIRKGGMGAVYEVTEEHAPFRSGVLKIQLPTRTDTDAFEREIDRLRRHVCGKYGPAFYGIGTIQGQSFVIMQRGRLLTGKLGPAEALAFFRDLADGTDSLLDAGLCHGDVKQANVAFFDGHAGLLDFGAMRRIIPSETAEPLTYTPGCAPPDLAENDYAVPWVDVYGCAAMANEILTDKALAIFSPTIREGLNFRAKERLPTVRAFYESLTQDHENHRKRLRRIRLLNALKTALIFTASVGMTVLFVVAFNTKRWNCNIEQRGLLIETSAHLRAGRYFYDKEIMSSAKRCFQKAAELGDMAHEILRLMEEVEKSSTGKHSEPSSSR